MHDKKWVPLLFFLLVCGGRFLYGAESADLTGRMPQGAVCTLQLRDGSIETFENTGTAFSRLYLEDTGKLSVEGLLWHNNPQFPPAHPLHYSLETGNFQVYQHGVMLGEYTLFQDAVSFGLQWHGSWITGSLAAERGHRPYRVIQAAQEIAVPFIPAGLEIEAAADIQAVVYQLYQDETCLSTFDTVEEAVEMGAEISDSYIVASGLLWTHDKGSAGAWAAGRGNYLVFQHDAFLGQYFHYEDALWMGQLYTNARIVGQWIVWQHPDWQNSGAVQDFQEFDSLAEAIQTAQQNTGIVVAGENSGYPQGTVLWEYQPGSGVLLENVPFLLQNPELPRGCEVTSLAMLLQYNGVDADKMTLAEEVRRAPNRYDDPNNGFIGDMYALNTHGLGVYHGPIAELAETYLPGRILDLTGCTLDQVLYYLDGGQPVWTIINSRYRALPESEFETWLTPSGPIRITYREHSVLLIGYDENYIYFHDPLSRAGSRAGRRGFEEGWIQMGSQAIVCLP